MGAGGRQVGVWPKQGPGRLLGVGRLTQVALLIKDVFNGLRRCAALQHLHHAQRV
ncbi:MAG: hypothetical protein RLZZ126_85, partial [Pseudomonadota bacterium]